MELSAWFIKHFKVQSDVLNLMKFFIMKSYSPVSTPTGWHICYRRQPLSIIYSPNNSNLNLFVYIASIHVKCHSYNKIYSQKIKSYKRIYLIAHVLGLINRTVRQRGHLLPAISNKERGKGMRCMKVKMWKKPLQESNLTSVHWLK